MWLPEIHTRQLHRERHREGACGLAANPVALDETIQPWSQVFVAIGPV
jgi:hypothetical protein